MEIGDITNKSAGVWDVYESVIWCKWFWLYYALIIVMF